MDKINVQILFTKSEYELLKHKADALGIPVSLYIKGEVLKEDVFGKYYRLLLEKVEELPSGTKYNIKALFGVGWTMERGIKLNLGKTYYAAVNGGSITNAKCIGKDSSNVMWYEKI